MTSPSPTANDVVLAESHGPVLVLTLNRPTKLNAWNDAMESRYFALLDEAEADPDVRAVVLTGAGRGFCSGADMEDMAIVGEREDISIPQAAVPHYRPLTFRKPLIAAINGAAAGIGLVHALYCDIRFAAPDTKFTTSFSRRGLVAEYGASWLLPRIVGRGRAADLLFSSRVVNGKEATSIGLVDFVAESDQVLSAAIKYASDLASNCSPASVSTIKAQLLLAEENSFYEAFTDADARTLEALNKPDLVEGVMSYIEGRPPAFPGLSFPQE
ncbi:enoyl-CoA hydratase-related protein [Nocardia sp. NPDC003183]